MKKLFSVFAGAYPSVESCYKDDLRDRALDLFKKSKLYETTAETLSDAMQSFVLSSVFREFIDYKFRNEYSLFYYDEFGNVQLYNEAWPAILPEL